MPALDFFCNLCGTPGANMVPSALKACSKCGATWRTVEIAAALLREAGRGYHAFLDHLVADPAFNGLRILDITFDLIIEQSLQRLPHYRMIAIASEKRARKQKTPYSIHVDDRVLRDIPIRNGLDAILVRDLLRLVPDLHAFLGECFRVIESGGVVIFQDHYRWPLPDEISSLTNERGDISKSPKPLGGSEQFLMRELGANFLDELKSIGFVSYFDRPAIAIDPLYRHGVVIGVKP
jgi:SAM-dependent methyltransferase